MLKMAEVRLTFFALVFALCGNWAVANSHECTDEVRVLQRQVQQLLKRGEDYQMLAHKVESLAEGKVNILLLPLKH